MCSPTVNHCRLNANVSRDLSAATAPPPRSFLCGEHVGRYLTRHGLEVAHTVSTFADSEREHWPIATEGRLVAQGQTEHLV